MSWAYGVNENGREIGYSVPDTCNHKSCKRKIDRGLSYRCGGVAGLHREYGCGDFFCWNHLYLDNLCPTCHKNTPQDEEE